MRQLLFIFLSTLSLLTSCSRTAYVPSVQNVPMLTEKHDINGTVALSYINAAYAATDHIGLILNAEHNSYFKNPSEDPFSKKHIIQFGAGYFTAIDDVIILEAYGGLGFGKISFGKNNSNVIDFSARQVQYFIQPSISFKSPYVEFGLSAKFTGLDFYNINEANYNFEELEEESFDLRQINAPFYTLFEPALTIRSGLENIKFSFQIQHSFMLEQRPLSRRGRLFVLGVNIRLNNTPTTRGPGSPYIDNFYR